MRRSLTRFDQLISEELAGIITPEDQAALDEAKAVFPEVNKLWELKHAIWARKEVQEWADRDMTPPVVSRRPVMKRYKRILIVAAILLAVLGTLIYKGIPPGTFSLPPRTLELRLENGKVYDLSYARHEEGDNISLNIQDTILSFSSTSNCTATLSVPEGKDYNINLPDGSTIRVNSASSISFPLSFDDTARNITLAGEAYFKVAREANRPFTVALSNAEVKVLGTEFNINSYDRKHPSVALVSGGVQLYAGKKSQVLKPGQIGTYTGKGIDTARFNPGELLGWRHGLFKFKETSLEDLCKVIPRWFGRKIVIDEPELGKDRFTGDFNRKNSLEENLGQFKMYGIDYKVENEVVHIIRQKDKSR